MTVKREDLVAAAAAGVLQYTQVEPMLIFLLQRDVQLKRTEMLAARRAGHVSGRHVLFYMAAILVIGLATSLIAFYTRLAFDALGVGGLLWFVALYALFTVAMAAWFERQRVGVAVRVFSTSVVALLPLAVFASQQFNLT